MHVRAKKYLGQHFLTDKNIAVKITNALKYQGNYPVVVEVGPGKGILTEILFTLPDLEIFIIDIDKESIDYLKEKFVDKIPYIVFGDFLQCDLKAFTAGPMGIIGNFPYNISSQILFKVLENKSQVTELVGMFQKEVAERIHALPSTKAYGILSVLIQAYYDTQYLFTVNPGVFHPPPKVKSAVIRLTKKEQVEAGYNESLFMKIVKLGFNYRRKTLRNALAGIIPKNTVFPFMELRAEVLTVNDFIELTHFFNTLL